MRPWVVLGLAFCLFWGGCGADRPPADVPVPPQYPEAEVFLRAIGHSREEPFSVRVTGLTMPHHLLAADLIAAAFHRLRGHPYRRLILFSPDHFKRGRTAVSVTFRDFQTVFGPVATDRQAVARLLANPLVSVSELFSHEHGVQALLPFVAYYFPQAGLVPLAIHPQAQPQDWDSLAQTLIPLLEPDTLVIQSTDFSHYLSRKEAEQRDQETLRVLSGGQAEAILSLKEPAHLDSRAAQYLQLRLQTEIFKAKPTVMAHKNSQDYASEPLSRTTSYLVQYYSREPLPVPGAETWFFAGDTFLGRAVGKALASKAKRDAMVGTIHTITRGAPLMVNLEGVVLERCPPAVEPYKLCMEAQSTLELLKALNIRVVSLANNHAHDYGAASYEKMKELLRGRGLTVLEQSAVADLGRFRLAAFTDVDNHSQPRGHCLGESDLESLTRVTADKPLFALVHWGREFAAKPTERQQLIADRLTQKGVELIIGSHPHRTQGLTATRHSLRVFSLGNFVFDQKRPEASGALLEVIFFPTGKYFVRLHPLANLYAKTLLAIP
ncbi:MAG: AmmeMemoRadiSam system protein B [Desulfobaccales bacterium]